MLNIELIGNLTAICGNQYYQHPRKDPIAPLCRKLIDHGHAPETLVSVHRNGRPVFKPRSLAAWAKYDIIDMDDRGLVRRKHRALPVEIASAIPVAA